ncbi:MAG: flagellar biosynthetic protein FliR [Pirellulales bacterium]
MSFVEFGSSQLLLLVLVLVRTGGIMLVAPVFGTNEVPPTIRALLAFTLALLMMPVQASAAPVPRNLIDFGLMVTAETLIGLTLGLGVMVFFSAFQLTGQVIGQLSGMSLGDVFNPGFNDNMPLFSHLLYLVTLAAYMLIGGHRLLLGGLLETFQTLPPGSAIVAPETERLFANLMTESFELGLRAAAPATVALLLATLVLGMVSRALPQLNVLALGFGFNALVTFGILSITFGGACWLLQDRLAGVVEAILETLHPHRL